MIFILGMLFLGMLVLLVWAKYEHDHGSIAHHMDLMKQIHETRHDLPEHADMAEWGPEDIRSFLTSHNVTVKEPDPSITSYHWNGTALEHMTFDECTGQWTRPRLDPCTGMPLGESWTRKPRLMECKKVCTVCGGWGGRYLTIDDGFFHAFPTHWESCDTCHGTGRFPLKEFGWDRAPAHMKPGYEP